MGHSYSNRSMGGSSMGDSGPKFQKIGEVREQVPPPGASNSYEQVRKKIDAHDTASMGKRHYTREKMSNK